MVHTAGTVCITPFVINFVMYISVCLCSVYVDLFAIHSSYEKMFLDRKEHIIHISPLH